MAESDNGDTVNVAYASPSNDTEMSSVNPSSKLDETKPSEITTNPYNPFVTEPSNMTSTDHDTTPGESTLHSEASNLDPFHGDRDDNLPTNFTEHHKDLEFGSHLDASPICGRVDEASEMEIEHGGSNLDGNFETATAVQSCFPDSPKTVSGYNPFLVGGKEEGVDEEDDGEETDNSQEQVDHFQEECAGGPRRESSERGEDDDRGVNHDYDLLDEEDDDVDIQMEAVDDNIHIQDGRDVALVAREHVDLVLGSVAREQASLFHGSGVTEPDVCEEHGGLENGGRVHGSYGNGDEKVEEMEDDDEVDQRGVHRRDVNVEEEGVDDVDDEVDHRCVAKKEVEVEEEKDDDEVDQGNDESETGSLHGGFVIAENDLVQRRAEVEDVGTVQRIVEMNVDTDHQKRVEIKDVDTEQTSVELKGVDVYQKYDVKDEVEDEEDVSVVHEKMVFDESRGRSDCGSDRYETGASIEVSLRHESFGGNVGGCVVDEDEDDEEARENVVVVEGNVGEDKPVGGRGQPHDDDDGNDAIKTIEDEEIYKENDNVDKESDIIMNISKTVLSSDDTKTVFTSEIAKTALASDVVKTVLLSDIAVDETDRHDTGENEGDILEAVVGHVQFAVSETHDDDGLEDQKEHVLGVVDDDKDHVLGAVDDGKEHVLGAVDDDKEHVLGAVDDGKVHVLEAVDYDKEHVLGAGDDDKEHENMCIEDVRHDLRTAELEEVREEQNIVVKEDIETERRVVRNVANLERHDDDEVGIDVEEVNECQTRDGDDEDDDGVDLDDAGSRKVAVGQDDVRYGLVLEVDQPKVSQDQHDDRTTEPTIKDASTRPTISNFNDDIEQTDKEEEYIQDLSYTLETRDTQDGVSVDKIKDMDQGFVEEKKSAKEMRELKDDENDEFRVSRKDKYLEAKHRDLEEDEMKEIHVSGDGLQLEVKHGDLEKDKIYEFRVSEKDEHMEAKYGNFKEDDVKEEVEVVERKVECIDEQNRKSLEKMEVESDGERNDRRMSHGVVEVNYVDRERDIFKNEDDDDFRDKCVGRERGIVEHEDVKNVDSLYDNEDVRKDDSIYEHDDVKKADSLYKVEEFKKADSFHDKEVSCNSEECVAFAESDTILHGFEVAKTKIESYEVTGLDNGANEYGSVGELANHDREEGMPVEQVFVHEKLNALEAEDDHFGVVEQTNEEMNEQIGFDKQICENNFDADLETRVYDHQSFDKEDSSIKLVHPEKKSESVEDYSSSHLNLETSKTSPNSDQFTNAKDNGGHRASEVGLDSLERSGIVTSLQVLSKETGFQAVQNLSKSLDSVTVQDGPQDKEVKKEDFKCVLSIENRDGVSGEVVECDGETEEEFVEEKVLVRNEASLETCHREEEDVMEDTYDKDMRGDDEKDDEEKEEDIREEDKAYGMKDSEVDEDEKRNILIVNDDEDDIKNRSDVFKVGEKDEKDDKEKGEIAEVSDKYKHEIIQEDKGYKMEEKESKDGVHLGSGNYFEESRLEQTNERGDQVYGGSRNIDLGIEKLVQRPQKVYNSNFDSDLLSSEVEDRSFADNLSEIASPDTIPQRLPSPPEPKDLSPFDPHPHGDSPSPLEEDGHLFEHQNGGLLRAGEVEGETKFGVDGSAVTSTTGDLMQSDDENGDEGSNLLDTQGLTTTETEPSVDEMRSGEYGGRGFEQGNDTALMSMSMEGSFYDDGGELIGGDDRRNQTQTHLYEDGYITEESSQHDSSEHKQENYAGNTEDPRRTALSDYDQEDDKSHSHIEDDLAADKEDENEQSSINAHAHHINGVCNRTTDSIHDSRLAGGQDALVADQGSRSADSFEKKTDRTTAVEGPKPKENQAFMKEVDISNNIHGLGNDFKKMDKRVVDSAILDKKEHGEDIKEKSKQGKAPHSDSTDDKKIANNATNKPNSITHKSTKDTKVTNGKGTTKKLDITTNGAPRPPHRKHPEGRSASAAPADRKSSGKSASSPDKTTSPTATTTKPIAPLPSYAQPIVPRKPREARPLTAEERKKKTTTVRASSATPLATRPQSVSTTTSSDATTKPSTRTIVTVMTSSRIDQLARPKSSPTKMTNGVVSSPSEHTKSPTKKIGTDHKHDGNRPGSGHSKVASEKKDKTCGKGVKSPTKQISNNTLVSPKTGEVKSKIGSLDNATHTPGGGHVKITHKRPDYTNVSSKVGSKDNIDYKPGGGHVKIENRKLKVDAKSKIGSLDNSGHKPGGGDKKIENHKLDWQASSKIGAVVENGKGTVKQVDGKQKHTENGSIDAPVPGIGKEVLTNGLVNGSSSGI